MSRLALAVCGVALVCACQSPTSTGSSGVSAPPDGPLMAEVVAANDGDSVVMAAAGEELEVRLMGINAPERDECFYDEASDHLSNLIEGEMVGLEVIGIDQFDRTLGYVWLDDLLVNLDLVNRGFAIATTPDEGDSHGETLIAAEKTASGDGRGLWSATACGSSGEVPPVVIDDSDAGFNPPGPDEDVLDQEWVSLTSQSRLDLGGWTIRDESSEHRCHLPRDTVIAANTELVVTSADSCWEPGDSPVWNNAGDLVLLLDESGRVVASHRYTG